MGSVRVGDWTLAGQITGSFKDTLMSAIEGAMREECLELEKMIKKGIRNQSPGDEDFTSLSDLTLANRSFTGKGNRDKILMVDGDLIGSVTNKVEVDKGWVGVNKKKLSEGGESMSNIAAVHEFGFEPIVVPYTDKVRKYLMAMMTSYGIEPQASEGGQKDVLIISIPPRPFLKPSFDKWSKGLPDRWRSGVAYRMQHFGT